MAVTPTSGKTHGKYTRVIVDGVDLSGDMRTIGSMGVTWEPADYSGFQAVRDFGTGMGRVVLDGFQALFSNTASTGSHTELSALESYYVTVALGIREAPTVGAPAFAATLEQGSYVPDVSQGSVTLAASFFSPTTETIDSKVWGHILATGATLSASSSSGSIDNGASSANGAAAFLHVVATSSGNYALKIEDSANDSAWSDLITFTADGSAVTAERGSAAGTVDRYVRFTYTKTAGTFDAWVSFIRL